MPTNCTWGQTPKYPGSVARVGWMGVGVWSVQVRVSWGECELGWVDVCLS